MNPRFYQLLLVPEHCRNPASWNITARFEPVPYSAIIDDHTATHAVAERKQAGATDLTPSLGNGARATKSQHYGVVSRWHEQGEVRHYTSLKESFRS